MAGWWICCWHIILPGSPERRGSGITDILKKSMRDIAILWKRCIAWISFFAYNYSKLLSGRKMPQGRANFFRSHCFTTFFRRGAGRRQLPGTSFVEKSRMAEPKNMHKTKRLMRQKTRADPAETAGIRKHSTGFCAEHTKASYDFLEGS